MRRLYVGELFSGGSCIGANLQEDEMETGEPTEVRDDEQLAGFFRDVQRTYASVARRTEEMLDSEGEGRTPTGVRPGGVPAEGDPGDVSPGQDVTTPAELPPRSAL